MENLDRGVEVQWTEYMYMAPAQVGEIRQPLIASLSERGPVQLSPNGLLLLRTSRKMAMNARSLVLGLGFLRGCPAMHVQGRQRIIFLRKN